MVTKELKEGLGLRAEVLSVAALRDALSGLVFVVDIEKV